jgi:2-methylcitrate dehydratase PrpD
MSHTRTVAEWIANLRWQDLPPEVITAAKRCLIDHLACTAGGARSAPGQIAAELALGWGGKEEAHIMGQARTVAARHAAFANATMANALDYDDTYHGHPGATTFPTALAAAEKWNAGGQEFILAVVAGYEIAVRAMALGRPLIPRYQAMWDLGTLQAFGAAAAAARLAGLDADGIANALGLISGTAPVPLPRKERYEGEGRSMLKSAYGWAADSAVIAAELTLAGFSGPGHALDDNWGFWELTPSERLGVRDFSDRLGEHWSILGVEFKPFMACRFIHPVLQGVEEIMKRRAVTMDDVQQVEIDSFELLADEHHYILDPVSGTDAQFSVPYTVAAMIQRGRLTPESYESITLHDAGVLQLAQRVHVNIDEDFDTAFPSRLGARVRIVLNSGESEAASVEHPRGSADQAMTEAELLEKFWHLAEPLLGSREAGELLAAINRLDTCRQISEVTDLFRPH